MTALYIYAVSSTESMNRTGWTAEFPDNLCFHRTDDLAVIYEPVSSATIEVTRDAVEHHHRVVSSLWSFASALPVQFGTVARSTDEIDELLKPRHGALLRDLERLRDTVEFGITVSWDPDAIVESRLGSSPETADASRSAGTGYMTQKLIEYRRESELERIARNVRAELAAEIDHMAIETSEDILPENDLAVRVRYLIRADQVDEFANAVGAIRLSIDELEIHVIGPWPPYSFVTSRQLRLPGMNDANSQ